MNVAQTQLQNSGWQQALVSSIEVGIVVVDKSFVVEEWNQFMQNHTGHDVANVRGYSLFNFFEDLDKDWLINKCQPVFEMNTPVFMIWEQRHYLFKVGTARPVTSPAEYMYQNISIFPIADDSGNVERICFLVYDVTDHAMSKQRIEGLNNRLKEISRVDGLTQLFNRRHWQECFEREYKLAIRHKKPVSVLMLDIDHFKKVNDTYGHQAGDAVIQSISKIIKKATRETDIAGRYGGEEFVILLPDTPAESAFTVGERIRKASEKTVVTHEDSEISVTVSAGIAEFSPVYKQPLVWLEAADQALYEAKNAGRNRVIVTASAAE
ncbi:sensor domain-containing diguanylate cyclase [Agaribacter marinus]|uniref:diguanylate cyclase n=1 Tax=Agaribacter marinus TaxID=1431249 RepID=A0AA37WLE7_9ALTE|nr:sensor domain-containing diguanylate cyclase [Agaribacter marinus]GLR72394.1 diguanylate cyclase [Agaribacter marinus]